MSTNSGVSTSPPAPVGPEGLPPAAAAPLFFLVGPCTLEVAELGSRLEHPLIVRLAAFVHAEESGVAVT